MDMHTNFSGCKVTEWYGRLSLISALIHATMSICWTFDVNIIISKFISMKYELYMSIWILNKKNQCFLKIQIF
jgi:hypothetical protein